MRPLGTRIRIARLTRELTQADLAETAGISRSFISLIERGGRGVDVVRLLRIAAAQNMPLADLVNTGATSGDPRRPCRRPTGSHIPGDGQRRTTGVGSTVGC